VRKSRAEQDWHPALRSLDAGSLSASLPSLRQQRRLHGTGSPHTNPYSGPGFLILLPSSG
jgi:hypothetical protein